MKKPLIFFAIGFLFFSENAFAADVEPYVEIISPQIRERNSMLKNLLGFGREAEVYMGIYIESGYKKTDALIAVKSDLAESYKFFRRTDLGKAIPEEEEMHYIPLGQYKETNLKYMGTHIRLYGIDYMPKEGENFPLTLIFREAGKVEVKARVIMGREGI